MFQLHPRLAADTMEITRWDISRVLLMKDANYPWLILVPARQGISGLHELAGQDLPKMMDEITRASRALIKLYEPVRINVGALGNIVEQLHIHIIARFEDDATWPAPVWGARPTLDYSPEGLQDTARKMRQILEQ